MLKEQICNGAYGHMMGASPLMQKLFEQIASVSQNHFPVLIQGESGTGKELVARCIHDKGPLAHEPFLPIDCGSLVSTLIESELFGYARGAFTGALCTKVGLLEAAGHGTAFLDEIGEMPVDLQSKFLRALQEKEVRPVGSNRLIKIAARIIAASNRDLEVAMQRGHFREDLYFRLNVVSLRLPPLRARKSDIPLLANHLIEKHQLAGEPRMVVSETAMNRLMAYEWPGNVRELENCIERALALGSEPTPQSDVWANNAPWERRPAAIYDIIANEPPAVSLLSPAVADSVPPLREALGENVASLLHGAGGAYSSGDRTIPWAESQKQIILGALRVAGGDRCLAARLLGIGKTTIYRKLKEYNVLKTSQSAAPRSLEDRNTVQKSQVCAEGHASGRASKQIEPMAATKEAGPSGLGGGCLV